MLADWTPKKQALLTEDALLKKLREYASTPEFSVNLQANIEAERIRHEEWERKQREWWNKHKHDIYDI